MQSTGGLNALACTQSGIAAGYMSMYTYICTHPLAIAYAPWFSVSSWTSLQSGIAGSSSGTWTLSSSFNSDYNSEIAISGTVVIQGNGAVLDASTNGRFFNAKSGGSLTLQSLTLKNGKAQVG